ncbi:hypothetical protein GTW51_00455 [Aurantimonas aggregata]|uniref:Uncharacterized protein n=1 Tax=Aurantimonas aggregata TaxID=2047720 RepID=A0A6L9MBP1_9HYPH|nr:hypothetical protein [Aurantimonas aggregata]NDV85167.1 hypothetical protein [Aurantimonas aggregata]
MSDPSKPPRRNHTIWIAAASIVLALVVYFVFFTTTPEDATRLGDEISPSAVSEEPVDPAGAN